MNRGFRTRGLHAGQDPDPATGARAPPLYQTTSYVFDDADTAADLYALESDGDVYSRISNPTTRILERRLAALEAGVDSVVTASGMAAIDAITTVLASAGDNVVLSEDMYGGTSSYFSKTATRRGIEPRTVETLDIDAYADAIDEDTAFVHLETIANPSLKTPDFEAVADVAHDHRVPLVVDNTFATPALCRPLEHGADIVWESTTKWIHGSGTTVGGVVVDGGTFPWDAADYEELSGENPAFGVDFVERFGERAFAQVVRHRAVRSTGGCQSPFDAWQTIQGLETLALRMRAHCENARHVAEFLRDHDAVSWVSYPGFDDHETHELASKYLDGGYAGMVTFGLEGEDDEGSYEAAKTVCESVELVSFLANIGDAKSLLIHPASTTHAQLSYDEQRAAGVQPDMLRMSVGIEDAADIVADLDQAIERAVTTGASGVSNGGVTPGVSR
ncbi:O-acetylhomoserine aminocarboxypropyltransferase/cysteine synthase family protein [Haloferax sp. DFSO52]|uniref:O-acetylhomoserine aminocarboxypropyltransferase/cysteine synthase family protein n=1 Tax=Haloferax sp. DFSO52 TaxID=3388505 RepID=UPI003A8A9F1F